jgi:hypothetical protein
MQMIRKNDDRIDRKRVAVPYLSKCLAQYADMLCKQLQAAVCQIDREKEAAALKEIASIIGHPTSIALKVGSVVAKLVIFVREQSVRMG